MLLCQCFDFAPENWIPQITSCFPTSCLAKKKNKKNNQVLCNTIKYVPFNKFPFHPQFQDKKAVTLTREN